MLDLSVEKLFVLGLVALFVFGPERLPAAASWLARTLRTIKDFTHDANERIRSEIGPEFDHIHVPLRDLRAELGHPTAWRNPRGAVLRHLFDDPITSGGLGPAPGGWPPSAPTTAPGPHKLEQRPLSPGERAPIDPDAT